MRIPILSAPTNHTGDHICEVHLLEQGELVIYNLVHLNDLLLQRGYHNLDGRGKCGWGQRGGANVGSEGVGQMWVESEGWGECGWGQRGSLLCKGQQFTYVHTQSHTSAYVRTYTHARTHARTHAHTHTHTHTSVPVLLTSNLLSFIQKQLICVKIHTYVRT